MDERAGKRKIFALNQLSIVNRYFSDVCIVFSMEIDMIWFIIGEAIIGLHPLAYALINLTLLRPYRRALKTMMESAKPAKTQYNSTMISNSSAKNEDCML